MKAFALAAVTFLATLIVTSLIIGITWEVAGHGLIGFVVMAGSTYLMINLPYRVYQANKKP